MIGSVVLAAGESRRMGRPKPLVEIDGKPMLQCSVEPFLEVSDEVVVVLGHNPSLLIPVLDKMGVDWTLNSKYKEGMLSSVKAGVKYLTGASAAFVALGDQPLVPIAYLRKAISRWHCGRVKIVSPISGKKRGHPVLIDKCLFPELLSLKHDQSLKELLRQHEDAHEMISAREWALTDIDTPEDLEKFENRS